MESTFHVHLAGKEKASKYLSVFNSEQNEKTRTSNQREKQLQ